MDRKCTGHRQRDVCCTQQTADRAALVTPNLQPSSAKASAVDPTRKADTMNTRRIEGAVALVTGANRGTGRALTEAPAALASGSAA
jgi:hypothetical protein